MFEYNTESSVSVLQGSQRGLCLETQVMQIIIVIISHHAASCSIMQHHQSSSIVIMHHHIIHQIITSFITDCHSSLHHSLFIIIIRFCSRDIHHLVNILVIIVSSNISLLNALIGISESPLPLGIAALPRPGPFPPKSTQRRGVLLIWL